MNNPIEKLDVIPERDVNSGEKANYNMIANKINELIDTVNTLKEGGE